MAAPPFFLLVVVVPAIVGDPLLLLWCRARASASPPSGTDDALALANVLVWIICDKALSETSDSFIRAASMCVVSIDSSVSCSGNAFS